MKKTLYTIAFIYIFLIHCINAQPFTHPGIDMSKTDLEYMRNNVLEKVKPWEQYFETIRKSVNLNTKITPHAHIISGALTGGDDLFQSSHLAYQCAILWYITKEEKYAQKAIEIITLWSSSLRSFNENDAKLIAALTGYEFCNAAEILRYDYPKWTPKETEKMKKLMMTIYLPTLRYYFSEANGNWDAAIMHTLLSIAVFTDNKELFDNTIYHYLHAKANGSLIKYIYPNGQCQETTRDQGHALMGLYEYAGAARIAYIQGRNLLDAANFRLALGLEYTTSWIIGNDVFAYGHPSEKERYKYHRPGLRFCLDYYTSKGIDMPNLKQFIQKIDMSKPHNALYGITSCHFSIKNKNRIKIQASPIAYMAGAKTSVNLPQDSNTIIVRPYENLQEIINKYANSNKTIRLVKGEYKLKKSLIIPSNIHIYGEGKETILICEPSVRIAAIMLKDATCHNISIENLIIDGAWTHNPGTDPNTGRFNRIGRLSNQLSGIVFQGSYDKKAQNISLKDLTIINFSRNGVYISDANHILINNCDFSENGSQVVPGPRLTHNLFIQSANNIQIEDSRLTTSLRGSGITLAQCYNTNIETCEIARNNWHGILCSECKKIQISDCIIEGNDACGIFCDFLLDGNKRIYIEGNLIQYNNNYAIKCYNAQETCIKNNTYYWNGHQKEQLLLTQESKLELEEL